MLAKIVIQMYCVYRHVHFHHIQECLYPGREHCCGVVVCRKDRMEIQDLECRMCLERIAYCVPRIVARIVAHRAPTKIQVN
jgi:hypothetical protein